MKKKTVEIPDSEFEELANMIRNYVLEEVALEFDKMKFGDTSASFACFVRNMKLNVGSCSCSVNN
jgi:hypothetical protein